MRRDQLEHAIRAACQILEVDDVIVVGSQSILGTYREGQLPDDATMSMEVDILPNRIDGDAIEAGIDQLEAIAGEMSQFDETHGFSIDGVDLQTVKLPDGWRDRLIKVQNPNTAPPDGAPEFIGWCLEKHDLCAAKLIAFREKDTNFVTALLQAGLVDPAVIRKRLGGVSGVDDDRLEQAVGWLGRFDQP